ncbi:HAD-IA family hydrolase [Myxosarcina sp. GI1(2024)]
MKQLQCQAILFDLDGTLIDSTHCVENHWRQWAQQHNLNAEEILKISHGRPTAETIRLVAPHLDAIAEARTLDESQATNLAGVIAVSSAEALVSGLSSECWAIVTSGNRLIATNRLRHVGLPFPQVLITTDDVAYYKPHPEGYLKAAECLGIAPEDCLVIEDAPVGIEAARAARMRVIAVATTYPASKLSGANWCLQALSDLSIHPIIDPSGKMTALELAIGTAPRKL